MDRYSQIRAENEKKYGTDIGRIGRMLLADRYDDRTHFVFELLQNAEDALARQVNPQSRAVAFNLDDTFLQFAHWGKPFDEADVRAICGIAESTKEDLTAIGRFGIGFKSVYTFTDRPEVHSGRERFAIESYVWPVEVAPTHGSQGQTRFVLPLRTTDNEAHGEITEGLRKLDARALLFLRQIEEIEWRVEGGGSGLYLREKPDALDDNVRRVSLIGSESGQSDTEQSWLIFSRPAMTDDGKPVGNIEIAFALDGHERQEWKITPISDSTLVAFFPTVLPTNLGFLIQAPFRTTPSRDNVPRQDAWNQRLVREAATLLVDSLRWLRDRRMVDVQTLRCLPLDTPKFEGDARFGPVFTATREALRKERLIPTSSGDFVSGSDAKLPRPLELSVLLPASRLSQLFEAPDGHLAWIASDITQDRAPELRQYLLRELGSEEVTPEKLIARLDVAFLEAQDDGWIQRLYIFLNSQPAQLSRLKEIPLIRLEDGRHVAARSGDAFLPGDTATEFPTVRRGVCSDDEALGFLKTLGLSEADPVDDVVRNLLPKYQSGEPSAVGYETDLQRILAAFSTDSKAQREKLIEALRDTAFVAVRDAAGAQTFSKPADVYLATERLKALFAQVPGILFVDDSMPSLRGEDVRDLLEACGVSRFLRTEQERPGWSKLENIRAAAETTGTRSYEYVTDYSIHGLTELLGTLPSLPMDAATEKSLLLWNALADLEQRQKTAFTGTYRGQYYGRTRTLEFDPAFIELLNTEPWVPGAHGLVRARDVLFDSLDWPANPFLTSKIHFKSPVIETLAKEAGIEAGVLSMLKQLGVTTVAELQARLQPRLEQDVENQSGAEPTSLSGRAGNHYGQSGVPIDDTGSDPSSSPSGERAGGGSSSAGGDYEPRDGTRSERGGRAIPDGDPNGRTFYSYVAVDSDEEERDPDGLSHDRRMELEERAIASILSVEPDLRRTDRLNPGFDLYAEDGSGQPTKWVEVKAMVGTLSSRPVGLTNVQFETARVRREAYWLYVVESANSETGARLVKIRDPAGKARTFTFDRGWVKAATVVALPRS